MSDFAARISICHDCQRRQGDCAGSCACTLDGKDIIGHATEGYCPIGSFRLGLGDTMARIFHRTGVKAAVNKVTGGNCGCKKRQMALNQSPTKADE